MTLQDRLRVYLKSKSLTYKDFEEQCNLSNGTAARLRETTRKSTLDRIANACDLNIDWLLTGEGEMLNDMAEKIEPLAPAISEDSNILIPLVHIDSVGGIHSPNALSASEQYVERMIPFPDARHGDIAILQSGNSMSPTIPAGAIMQIRRVDGWREYFGYGNDFVLWLTDDRRITKQVLKYEPDSKNYVTCHSYNPEAADEELPKSMIQEVWKVVNVLINKGW